MPFLLPAPGLHVQRNRFGLVATLRPELDREGLRLMGVILLGCLLFLIRFVFEVTRTDAPPAEGIGWSEVLLLASGVAMLAYWMVRGWGHEVTLEISHDVFRYRTTVFGYGRFRDFEVRKIERFRLLQGTDEAPPALVFDYGSPPELVRCVGAGWFDLYRLLDLIRSFRPDLCEPEKDDQEEEPAGKVTQLGLSALGR